MLLDGIVLVAPGTYEWLDQKSVENCLAADQRVLSLLKKGIIDPGEEQLKSMTGYNADNIPEESPIPTDPNLDGIQFHLVTTVKPGKVSYQRAVDGIDKFLQSLEFDYDNGKYRKEVIALPLESMTGGDLFVDLDYLLSHAFLHVDFERGNEYEVENKVDKVVPPKELVEEELNSLALSIEMVQDFDITNPGAAKLWYRAREFYNLVKSKTKNRLEDDMKERAGLEVPKETKKYWEQVAGYLVGIQKIPSPQRQSGKTFHRMFKVPQRGKQRGSKALPVVVTTGNYTELLEEYRPILSASLKKWKKLDGNIGELTIFHYDLQDEEKVREQFPFLPEYHLQRTDECTQFVSIAAVRDRMLALQEDYKNPERVLYRHTVAPLV